MVKYSPLSFLLLVVSISSFGTYDKTVKAEILPEKCTDQFPLLHTTLLEKVNAYFVSNDKSIAKKTDVCNNMIGGGLCYAYLSFMNKACAVQVNQKKIQGRSAYYQFTPSTKAFCKSLDDFIFNLDQGGSAWRKFFDTPGMPYFTSNEQALGDMVAGVASSMRWSSLVSTIPGQLSDSVKSTPIVLYMKYLKPILEASYVLYKEKKVDFDHVRLVKNLFANSFDKTSRSDTDAAIVDTPSAFAADLFEEIPWLSVYLEDVFIPLPATSTLGTEINKLLTLVEDLANRRQFGRFRSRLAPIFIKMYTKGSLGDFFTVLAEIYRDSFHCGIYYHNEEYVAFKEAGCFRNEDGKDSPPELDINASYGYNTQRIHTELVDDATNIQSCEEFIKQYTCYETDLSELGLLYCPRTWFQLCSAKSLLFYRDPIHLYNKKTEYSKKVDLITKLCCRNRIMCEGTKVHDGQVNDQAKEPELHETNVVIEEHADIQPEELPVARPAVPQLLQMEHNGARGLYLKGTELFNIDVTDIYKVGETPVFVADDLTPNMLENKESHIQVDEKPFDSSKHIVFRKFNIPPTAS